ncbi:tRNA (5-methylaminomethyl-2-thiouridine)(34)-methyltransferase MnmD [Rhodohalobacter sp.]|uniref:tRNA (5-methylaminomethyl-2-thiouridine)(34)-methyltransferase MnmD n=1 Tax=Rhodohalobacter sp. TaxID=1974210 RepID=UPI002ACD1FFE|nr:tRNA (5-methylaminomethyl-2-thiouridine)(34)-methyltransferase MnmD [Rhodohalobacter sp.]MDZ7755395.1 tRNA (5-methylaminomethyl-2-thiouridine)(34)-methyltransferase MnmD [Rhodohalobacter sp.]
MSAEDQKPRISETKDGSTTLYSPVFDQHYHNPNGAVAESKIVFFETPGLVEALQERDHIAIFEMGFGTGLNLILLKNYLEQLENPPDVDFYTVEAFPVDPETAAKFDFGDELKQQNPGKLLQSIFSEADPGTNSFQISEYLTLNLFIGPFDDSPKPDQPIDYFFHDPFSPDVNAELWTPEVFQRLKSYAEKSAILSTYCAASSARAAMAVAGWKIARAPGALGKREMTLASLDEKNLDGFKRVNEQRLADRYHQGDFD